MEEELCLAFYTILCCAFCCASDERPLSSTPPQGKEPVSDVVVNNPSSDSSSGVDKGVLKNESDLKKDGSAF